MEEKETIIPFPENIEYDFNVGNYTFDFMRLSQAIIIAIIVDVILFILLQFTGLKWTHKAVVLIIGLVLSAYIGTKGINGDSVFGYILNAIIHNRNKRITLYNPRIKTNMKFFANDTKDDYVVPREKIEEMYRTYIARSDKKSAEENLLHDNLENEQIFFEDDIDLMGKPTELMSEKELKKWQKKKEKEQRRLDKEERGKKNRARKNKETKKGKVAGLDE